MLLNQKIETWTETHHPAWLDLLRIGIGLFLIIQGITFMSDIWSLQEILAKINLDWDAYYLAYIIAFTHLIGGIFITIGLFTRMVIFFQIPILVCALIFMWPGFDYTTLNPSVPGSIFYTWSGLDNSNFSSEWWLALVTLVILLICWVLNSGPWSVDRYLEKYDKE